MTARNTPTQRERELKRQLDELQLRLAESEETLRAIREGEVDAVVVSGAKGEQVFSLLGSDSIYRLIVETMKEAAFTLALDGRILFCNAQFGLLLKRPLEAIVGHELHELVEEGNRAIVSSLVLAAQQQPVKQRLVFHALDGTSVPAHVSANILNQPDGLSICVVASDLTELENSTELIQQLRRQQETALAANAKLAVTEEELRTQNDDLMASRAELDRTRARYQDLFETAPDGYLVTDPDGTILEANNAAARLFGLPAAQLKGNPFSTLVPVEQREDFLRLLAGINAGTAPPPRWEVEIRPLEGPPFWAAITAAASRDEEGWIVGARWMIRDVTERVRIEQELRELNAELEHRVALRTTDLSKLVNELQREVSRRTQVESALRQRSEQLRVLAEELTLAEQRERRRLSEVLHDDLQQLLVSAGLHLAGLERAGDETMKQAVAQVRDLLNKSIDCSRTLTSELSPPILHHGGLAPALKWLASWMQERHGLTVELQAEEATLPEPEAMKILLFQSVRELLFNAVKHAKVGTAKVGLQRQVGEIEITVSDNGAGFDPQATMPPGKSGGFGIFSIRERLRLLGGTLFIDSAPGRGSRFTLKAPLTKPTGEESLMIVAPTATAPGKSPTVKSVIRVMLADDHALMRQGLANLLRREPDMEIVGEASDGEAAVKLARQIRPDVVLMDMSMPGMDGIEATRTIHAELPGIRLIGLSMFDESEQADAMLQAGAVKYLSKTGASESVIAAIRDAAAP